jgi:magnesium transporter
MAVVKMLKRVISVRVGYFASALSDCSGRDPAFGSAVLTTFITDSMGFFIFLGLATVVLL